MREFKFKAYDKYHKCFVSGHDVAHLIGNKNYIIVQYTGIRVYNSVELYECDIVNDSLVGVGQIKYSEKHAAFKILYKDNRTAKWLVDMFEKEMRIVEVIGNIYENPELLNHGSIQNSNSRA